MSGSGATSISGMRSPGAARRKDTARINKGINTGTITVHVIILGLAVLLWWIARDMVSANQQLENAGRLRFELSEELQADWRVFSQATVPVSLDVSGPIKEINDFAADLDQNPGRFAYRYEITQADLANLTPNSRHQVTLTLEIKRFEATGEAVAPPELRVRPIGATAGDKGGTFSVTLERFISRDAVVDLGSEAKGQIQIRLSEAGAPRPYSFVAEPRPTNPLTVRGPASLVDDITDAQGRARLRISVDAFQALENFAKTGGLSVERVLQQGSLVASLQLLPIEGVEVRERHADDDQERPVSLVNVLITYTAAQDYVAVSGNFTVDVVYPSWLDVRDGKVEELAESIPVDMRVLNTQQAAFNKDNVRVRLDLSRLERGDLNIESIEGTNRKRARVLNWFYSLEINTDRLTYEFINDKITAEQYQPVEVVIVWTED